MKKNYTPGISVATPGVTVEFTHDDEVKKWEAHVIGAATSVEARQAFSAIVLTCQALNPDLLKVAVVIEKIGKRKGTKRIFEIIPAEIR